MGQPPLREPLSEGVVVFVNPFDCQTIVFDCPNTPCPPDLSAGWKQIKNLQLNPVSPTVANLQPHF